MKLFCVFCGHHLSFHRIGPDEEYCKYSVERYHCSCGEFKSSKRGEAGTLADWLRSRGVSEGDIHEECHTGGEIETK